MIKFFTKYHKWLGVFLTILILLFSISGIILNHRNLVSGINISRKLLPKEYEYKYWNKGAVKGTLRITEDSILVYGNIGVWLTDSNAIHFTDLNSGFPKGIDSRKICKLFKSKNNKLFAGTLFGLFQYDYTNKIWGKVKLPVHNQRITDILEKQDTLFVLTRSVLLKSSNYKDFYSQTLPFPENYNNKISLFKTIWTIHSGELLGKFGILFVDLIGLIFIFLSVTGLILFFKKAKLKKHRNYKTTLIAQKIKRTIKWNLKWHNKIGWITVLFLTITTITGMFLRPPLLIAIAKPKVEKIPYSKLDNSNPWYDKLRRLVYDVDTENFIIATSEGLYYSDKNLKSKLIKFKKQPPVSIMGINVFKKIKKSTYLIGSFSGIFEWNIKSGTIYNCITKDTIIKSKIRGIPIGKNLISGYSNDLKNEEIYFTFDKGAIFGKNDVPFEMPSKIKALPMSLWYVALEVHTARIYHSVLGSFYLLIISLSGLIIIFVLISGSVVWFKRYKK